MASLTERTPELTDARKAELFDYLAEVLSEMKLIDKFGGNSWIYHEQGTSEELAQHIASFKEDEDRLFD